MSGGAARYPAYRDSGLPWLGEIPAHWEVRRNGRLFAERREAADPDLPLLEVSIRTGVRVRQLGDGGRKQAMADRSRYQRARAGDIAYNMMRMWQGAVGVVPTDGLVSPAYVVARPYEAVEPRYYAYLFRTAAYMQQVAIESRGIVPDRNRLYWDSFKAMPSLCPPISEQRAIAVFLSSHRSKVTQFARAKEGLIGLLKERRTSVVRQLLTGVATSSNVLRPSGSAVLGDVPASWRRVRLKHAATKIVGGATPDSASPEYWDGDVVWVTPEDVSQADQLVDSYRHLTDSGLVACAATVVPPGSIVITSRAPVGNVAIARVDLCTNQGCKAVVPDPSVVRTDYLFWLLAALRPDLEAVATGTTFAEVSATKVANLRIALPSVQEQDASVAEIVQRTSAIQRAIDRARSETALVEEYHRRLVVAAVYGQLRLPGGYADGAPCMPFGDEMPVGVDESNEHDLVTSDAD